MEETNKIEKRKKGSKKYIVVLFLFALIVGGSCGLYYIDTFYGQGKINTILSSLQQKKTTNSTETEETEETEQIDIMEQVDEKNTIRLSSGGALFATKGKKFLMCTKDGARYMNGMGDQKWNDTFTMTAPELIEEGDYYAIGDLSGKSVKVYDETGLLYTAQSTGNVLYFALNRNGYLGVITKEKEIYTVMVYDKEGTQLTGRQEGEKGVYPLSMDISDDNRVFAISYLDTTDVEPVGKVNFFFVNESEGKNFTESMFSGVIKNNELIAKVFYLDNGSLAMVSDRALYGIASNGEECWAIELTNHISYIGIEKKKYIVAAYGGAISGRDSKKQGYVSWINGDGKEIASFQAKDAVTYLNCDNTGTIIGCNKTYYGFKIGGRAFWEYTATKDMIDVLLMENVNNVLFVTNDSAMILNMDTVSQDTTVKEQKENVQSTEKVIKKQQDDEENKEEDNKEEDKQQGNEEEDNKEEQGNEKEDNKEEENKQQENKEDDKKEKEDKQQGEEEKNKKEDTEENNTEEENTNIEQKNDIKQNVKQQ
ncbi:DUF5711 family protein [Clostridium sp. MD294]|uniref:DUF5711 family protein n=1 Tax=Clostridium sp. MD294 TaxID=97138 RepID=UPI0002CB3B15|nr:DUF5711 family protein [Clostridium sp. MD294]NDO47203.1 hypothetical protein [Clostridium sp. MD294]USF29733.1 hypothetical protein C820_001135 [Clostridium sp. MD294]